MEDSSRPAPETPCGLGRRLGAMVYDAIVVIAIWMAGAALVVVPLGQEVASGSIVFQLYLLALAFAYFHVCWARLGQTLGMRTWRMHLDPGPRPFTIGRGLLRFGGGMASLATLGLGFAWALLRADRRAWPDLASDSRLVVRRG